MATGKKAESYQSILTSHMKHAEECAKPPYRYCEASRQPFDEDHLNILNFVLMVNSYFDSDKVMSLYPLVDHTQ